MSRRTEQVADLLQAEIAELLLRRVKHPALTGAMLSITRVEVSPDLVTARVHVSVMDGDDEEVQSALDRTAPYLHRELVKRLRMRRVPRLRFLTDRSIAEGDRISSLMRELREGDEPAT